MKLKNIYSFIPSFIIIVLCNIVMAYGFNTLSRDIHLDWSSMILCRDIVCEHRVGIECRGRAEEGDGATSYCGRAEERGMGPTLI